MFNYRRFTNMKITRQIRALARDILTMIQDNGLEATFAYEAFIARQAVEHVSTREGRLDVDYLADTYIQSGAFTLPKIKERLTWMVPSAVKHKLLKFN